MENTQQEDQEVQPEGTKQNLLEQVLDPKTPVFLLSAQNLMTLMGLSPTSPTAGEWRRDGRGPAFIKIGKFIRYRSDVVRQFLIDSTMQKSGASDE